MFNIENYPDTYLMHCKTEEEAKDFCCYLRNVGRCWRDGCQYEHTKWEIYGCKTVYNFNCGTYGNIECYRKDVYTILEWEDFMNKTFTKADLKTGDIVEFENGEVGCVIKEHNMIITRFCWIDLANYENDMSSKVSPRYSIKSVRRPRGGCECRFDAFEENRGDLVYDRERDEVEEMTLAEVCKLLGKNIKIVKE